MRDDFVKYLVDLAKINDDGSVGTIIVQSTIIYLIGDSFVLFFNI